jgi:hypothetical protein
VWWFPTQALRLAGTAPEACTPEVMAAVVQQHLDSPAMWAIFPLQVRAPAAPLRKCLYLPPYPEEGRGEEA